VSFPFPRFEAAQAEAEEADQYIASCSESDLEKLKVEKPFFGVPFTTKDCFAVEGLSYTAGLKARGARNVKADFNADAVKLVIFKERPTPGLKTFYRLNEFRIVVS